MFLKLLETMSRRCWTMISLVKRFFIFFKLIKEVDNMAIIYATLIVMGHKQFKEVPAPIKDKVREELINLDAEYLVIEE